MRTSTIAPVDNLYRGRPGIEIRRDVEDGDQARFESRQDDDPSSTTLAGHFAVFDTWAEIHSWFEGDFLERIAPGAFAKTIDESADSVRVQFDHGFDVHVGDAPLGPIETLREDDTGPYYEVPLLDTDYNRDRILPLLRGRTMDGTDRGSLLGASFRFRVIAEEWDREPGESEANPDALPERTITEVRLFEFGPVVVPAYPEATAGLRSLTDHYLERARSRSRNDAAGPATASEPPVAPPPHPTVPAGRSLLALRTSLHRHRKDTP